MAVGPISQANSSEIVASIFTKLTSNVFRCLLWHFHHDSPVHLSFLKFLCHCVNLVERNQRNKWLHFSPSCKLKKLLHFRKHADSTSNKPKA